MRMALIAAGLLLFPIWASVPTAYGEPLAMDSTASMTTLVRDPVPDLAQARRAYDQGKDAYARGKFAAAAALFTRAYQLGGPAAVLFNLGQSHRRAGTCAEAQQAYERYLIEVPSASQRATAQKHRTAMSECAARLTEADVTIPVAERAQSTSRETTPPDPLAGDAARETRGVEPNPPQAISLSAALSGDAPVPPQERLAATPVIPDQPPVQPTAVMIREPARRSTGLRTAGLVTLAVGGAVLVGGVVAQSASGGQSTDDPDDADDADETSPLGSALTWGGGAVAAVGAVMAVWGHVRTRTPAVVVAPKRGGAMLVRSWQF
jgi:hypothetical protein